MDALKALLVISILITENVVIAQQKIVDSLEIQLETNHNNDKNKLEVLNELSYYYSALDAQKGLEKANTAIALAKKMSDSLQLGIAYSRKALNYSITGKDSLAIEMYTIAEGIHTRNKHTRRLTSICFNMGLIYFKKTNYRKALAQTQKAFDAFEKLKDTIQMGRIYNSIALNQMYLGDYIASLKSFQEGLKLFRLMKDEGNIYNGYLYSNMGLLYEKLDNYEEALNLQTKALKFYEKYNFQSGLGDVYINIGNLYDKTGYPEKAIESYEDSYSIKKKIGDLYGIASALTNIGITHHKLKQYDKAIYYLNKTIPMHKELANNTNLSIVNKSIGDINLDKKQIKKASSYYEKAILYAKNAQNIKQEQSALEGLSTASFLQGNYKKAYLCQRDALKLKDSLLSDEKIRQFAKLEADFKYDKEMSIIELEFKKEKALKQVEIEQEKLFKRVSIGIGLSLIFGIIIGFTLFNKKKVAERKKEKAEDNYKLAVAELNFFRSQMSPHFIFNALNSIRDYVHKNSKTEASKYITKFSYIMRKMLHNLQNEEISLDEEIEFLKMYLDIEQKRLNNTFEYIISVDKIIEIEYTLIPPLLLQPFIENSIWHGIAEKEIENGLVKITFEQKENYLICSIDDNGVGINLGSKKQHNEKSLAIEIAKNRLNLFDKLKNTKSKISIFDKIDEVGVYVEIKLPLSLKF